MGKHCDLPAAPIVVTARGMVLNGHARLAVAQQCGADEVPAIRGEASRYPDWTAGGVLKPWTW